MIGKALRLLKCLVRNDCPLKIRGKDLFSIMVVQPEVLIETTNEFEPWVSGAACRRFPQ
jgi:hypothetical protein